MSFRKVDYKASQTGMRFDMRVEVNPLFAEDWSFRLRIISPEPLEESEVNKIISEVIEKRKSWRPSRSGKSKIAPHSRSGVSAYIL